MTEADGAPVGARIMRSDEAPAYIAAGHRGVTAVRLQGNEAGPTKRFWVGRSTYAPGGTAELNPTKEETVYLVLAGQLTLTLEDSVHVLNVGDSVHLPQGTERKVDNHTESDAVLLVTVALTPE